MCRLIRVIIKILDFRDNFYPFDKLVMTDPCLPVMGQEINPFLSHTSHELKPNRLLMKKLIALAFVASLTLCTAAFAQDNMKSDKMKKDKMSSSKMNDGKMADAKMSDGKMKEHKMSDSKMKDGKMSDGKMKDGKMSDGKMKPNQ